MRLSHFAQNLIAGLKILTGRSVARQHVHVSLRFVLSGLLLGIGLMAALDYALQSHVRFWDVNGSAILGCYLAIALLIAIICTHIENDYPQLPVLLTLLAACFPWLAVALSLFPYSLASAHPWVLVLLLGYCVWVIVRCLRIAFYYPSLRSSFVAITFMVAVAVFGWGRFFYPNLFDSYNPADYEELPHLDAEHLFYQQRDLVDDQLMFVSPSAPGSTDHFFIGFGGSDLQTVFETETLYAKKRFEELYATKDRSLILFNNTEKLDSQPIANSYNLKQAINGVGDKMSGDDVLILLLTSHGDDDATLSVDLESLDLRLIEASELRAALDMANIKWRVIIISACFSGSFIDELESDHTLIITAASADRSSFGCSSDRELTVFGEAFLKYSLDAEHNWVTAFDKARTLIAEWETEADVPQSQPQIRLGPAIQRKLGLPSPPTTVVQSEQHTD
ncbi:MAG: C13 family peptidase [Pseudomonadota bacterium]